MQDLYETLKLMGLMLLWAAVSLALIPFWPIAAPALLEWYGLRPGPTLDAPFVA